MPLLGFKPTTPLFERAKTFFALDRAGTAIGRVSFICDLMCVFMLPRCQHGMARFQVSDGRDGLQIWRVTENILNKQSRTADRGWSSRFGVGRGTYNSSPQK
jgi:hypothetical protein